MWIRHVLVPGYTDSDETLKKIGDFAWNLGTVEKVQILPYHTLGKSKYEKMGLPYPLESVEPPTEERVRNARRIMREAKENAEKNAADKR